MYISQEMTDEQKEAVLEHLGMDKSMPEQYLGWLKQAVKGDFGVSLANRTSVTPQILSRLPATLLLMGTALFLVHCTCDPSRTLVRVSEKQLGR